MTPEDLKAVGERARCTSATHGVRVCCAAGCLSRGADGVHQALKDEASRTSGSETETVEVKSVGCMGLCSAGPLVRVSTQDRVEDVLYRDVRSSDAVAIIASAGTTPVERLRCDTSAPFFTRQSKIVLENCGWIDPERIEDYISEGGYSSLLKGLTEMSPQEVLDEVTASRLRGRGGGGYPVGLKWNTVAKADDPSKYVVCNADEGDPGAFMDRSLLESDPHRVLEGMAIAGYAVGASHGYVYVRAEYPLAIERLRGALRQARAQNLLGPQICGTRFTFTVDIRLGAGAFVCGEETALLASIEGLRGQPRPRPPYPAERGLFGHSTLINNVESFANIAPIVRNGGDWYAKIGTENSKGTKVFALAGQVTNTGLIEVPMGMSLREIVYDIGGGVPAGGRVKAVQTGGPSGGCIPEQYLDSPVDYDSLQQLGSMMGSGGMIVMDESASMVEVARYFMEFCMSESCGKCAPCRVGTYQLHALLQRIAEGRGAAGDRQQLARLCRVVQETSLCGLGQSAPNPVLSTLRYFEHEYEALLSKASATENDDHPRGKGAEQ